jgi:hypothetical protein
MRHLRDWLEGYMILTENTEPCELYRKWVGVSVIASALQRKCFLQWGSQTWYPNFYIVLSGPPAESRKGTAMVSGFDLLRHINVKLCADRLTPEQFIREMSESTVCSQISNNTFMNHSSYTVYSREFTVFLGYKNSAFLSDLTDLYDCADSWSYRTKGSGQFEIKGAWLNLLAATTPENLQAALPNEAFGGGFASRVVFIHADKKGKIVPMPTYSKDEEEIRMRLIQDLEQISLLSGRFQATRGYINSRTEWYISATEEEQIIQDPRFAAYYGRKITTATKLSMVLSASRSDDMELHEADFMQALDMINEAELSMPKAIAGVGKSDYAEVLPQVMAEILTRGEVTMQMLMRRFSHDTTQFHLQKMIEILDLMGVAKYDIANRKVIANPEFFQRQQGDVN